MSKKLIVGNWKMGPHSVADAKKLVKKVKSSAGRLSNTEVVICPPAPLLSLCAGRGHVHNLSVGAQNVSQFSEGSHTGEVSAELLRDMGVSHVIVGHSEVRAMGETDEIIATKLSLLFNEGITPILCIGERVHDDGGLYLSELQNQIKSAVSELLKKQVKKIVIAYEPIWAIGAEEPMRVDDIESTSLFIKKTFAEAFGTDVGLKMSVLYGGSVNRLNGPEIISRGGVEGLLVGRESLNSEGFVEMIRAVDKLKK